MWFVENGLTKTEPLIIGMLTAVAFCGCFALPPTFKRIGQCAIQTCAAQNKNCGSAFDGCGGELICGACQADNICGGSGVPNVCGKGASCQPESDADFCTRTGSSCQISAADNCGSPRTVVCGTNCVPECNPQTDTELCTAKGATCGDISVTDVCGSERTVNCGTCTAAGTSCQSNLCVAVPTITFISVIGNTAAEIRQGRGVTGIDGAATVVVAGMNLDSPTSVSLVAPGSTLPVVLQTASSIQITFTVVVPHGTPLLAHAVSFTSALASTTSSQTVQITGITVNPSAPNNTQPGTPAAPMRTLAGAIMVARGGDTIRLQNGEYSALTNGDAFFLNPAGAGNSYPAHNDAGSLLETGIIIVAENSRGAILRGPPTTAPSDTENDTNTFAFFIPSSQELTLRGLVMRDFERAIVCAGAVKLQDVEISDNFFDDVLIYSTGVVNMIPGPSGQRSQIGRTAETRTINTTGVSLLDSAQFVANDFDITGATQPVLVQGKGYANMTNATFSATSSGYSLSAHDTATNNVTMTCTNCTLNTVHYSTQTKCAPESFPFHYLLVGGAATPCIEFFDK